MKKVLTLLTIAAAMVSCSVKESSLLVEAEFFQNKGGWVRDGQFYEIVGSQYLLAHGMGIPVKDATTTVRLPERGIYHVWVRTYNWNAPWDSTQAPGVFQLLVNGVPTCEKLGDLPTKWDWQEAGTVEYAGGPMALALHDLTGFEGRADAIFFSKDAGAALPAERPAKVRTDKTEYDLVVIGAGPGGISAAVASARLGQKTLLLESRNVVGGNSAPGLDVKVSGGVNMPPYENLGNVISEYGIFYRRYDEVCKQLAGEDNLTLLKNQRVIELKMDGNRIASVTAVNMETGDKTIFHGKLYSDCTGDSFVGTMAGAEYMVGAETSDVYGEDLAPEKPIKLSYGSTIRWEAKDDEVESTFPLCPWAVQFNERTCMKKLFPGMFETGFGRDQIKEAERNRDYLFRVVYGNWSYLKNSEYTKEEFAKKSLSYVRNVLSKRESLRLVGDCIFTQKDVEGEWRTRYDDCAVLCTYPLDQHFPTAQNSADFPGEEFLATMKHCHAPIGIPRQQLTPGVDVDYPCMMPYRCFYSRNISNLFMAGRNVSVSRIALCAVRVSGSISMMGEVVGIASTICNKYGCTPREVYSEHLDELKTALTAGVPHKYEVVYVNKTYPY